MGIRRRRKKLTTLVSRLDSRIKSVELRPFSLLTESQIKNLIDSGANAVANDSATTTISQLAPNQFIKIQQAWFYPKKLTGQTKDVVEVYTEADLGVFTGSSFIEVYGLNGTSSTAIECSGKYLVKSQDSPPYDTRAAYKQSVPAEITNVYSYIPAGVGPASWSTARQLRSKRAIDSYAATGTSVVVTLNASHQFRTGDIVFVGLGTSDARLEGIDGLFTVQSVTATTLTYSLPAALEEIIPSTVPTELSYIYPVIHEYIAVGSTWADSSTNKVNYWDGIRWVDYSSVADPVRDGDPPAPPTNLQVTSEGVPRAVGSTGLATVTLDWNAPTQTAAGAPLNDLVGHIIRWRESLLSDWSEKALLNPLVSKYTFTDVEALFSQGRTYYFQVVAVDSGVQRSLPATATHSTSEVSASLYPPTAPQISSRLGVLTATWNGFVDTDPLSIPPGDTVFLKVHRSIVSNFTPSDSTLVSTISAVAGNFATFSDLTYETPYYFKFVLVNSSGKHSDPSGQSVSQVTPLVDTDLLVGNVLNSWAFDGNLISAGALADGSLNASNLFGPNVISQGSVAFDAIGANQIAAGSIIAGKIGTDAVTANTVAAGAISAGKIAANSILASKIRAGSLDAIEITGSNIQTARAVGSYISTYSTYSALISAVPTASYGSTYYVSSETSTYTFTQNTDPVTGLGTGSGAWIKSGSRQRVTLNNTGLYAYDTNGNLTFRVLGSSGEVYIASGVQIGGYATSGDLGIVDQNASAASQAASAASQAASTAGQTANTASSNATSAVTIANGKITIGNAAADVNANQTTIDGDGITTGTIDANRLKADSVLTNLVRTGPAGTPRIEIRGSNIANPGIVGYKNSSGETSFRFYNSGQSYLDDIEVAGTLRVTGNITGGTIRTSTNNKRVELLGSTNSLRFISGGSVIGEVEGETLGVRIDSTLGGFVRVGGGITMGASGTIGSVVVNAAGLVLTNAGSTTFAANLRRPDPGNAIQVVSSDVRIKENISAIQDGLVLVSQLNPITFNSKVDESTAIVSGFLAQEVRSLFPNTYSIVTENLGVVPDMVGVEREDFELNPLLSLNHIELIPYMVKAIQELSTKNDALEARLEALEGN